MTTGCSNRLMGSLLCMSVLMLNGCEGLALHDTSSLLLPRFQRSEALGFVAGLGTTFATVPDLINLFADTRDKPPPPQLTILAN